MNPADPAALTPPASLGPQHDLDGFDSGVEPLANRMKRRARANEPEGGLRSFVLCRGARVVAYYALSAVLLHAISDDARRF